MVAQPRSEARSSLPAFSPCPWAHSTTLALSQTLTLSKVSESSYEETFLRIIFLLNLSCISLPPLQSTKLSESTHIHTCETVVRVTTLSDVTYSLAARKLNSISGNSPQDQ